MENSEATIHEFLRKLAFKVYDTAFDESVLEQLKEIKAELASIKKECLDYQEKKYFDEFIPISKLPKLLDEEVSKRTVENWISKRLFKIIQVFNKRWVRRDVFDKFMKDHES
ncbi:MAG: hypothetical protein JEY96_14985 [Bacteroidales bacterium]|nr:hypothetical protein [Bacteroidales bacterium]